MTRTLWEEGHEPGREMVALGAALALTLTALDVVWHGDIGWVFDVGFVLLCLVLALAVRPADFFTVGVLPPQLMLGTFVVVATVQPGVLARPEDGLVQAVVSGLSHHSVALVVGYGLCLAVLHTRSRVVAERALRERRVRRGLSPRRNGPGRRLPA